VSLGHVDCGKTRGPECGIGGNRTNEAERLASEDESPHTQNPQASAHVR